MTVEIVCPHCRFTKQVPREKIPPGVRWATCPRCRQRFEIVLKEEEQWSAKQGPTADAHAGPDAPRGRYWAGLYQTAKAALLSPEKYFSDERGKTGISEPLAFGLLFGSIGAMFGWFWQFLFMWGNLGSYGEFLLGMFSVEFIFMGVILLTPLMVLVEMFFSALVLHLALIIVRGSHQGFDGTFRVIAYSQAARVFGLVPLIGGMVGWIWQLIIRIIGLRAIHETSYARVIAAFLLPVVAIGLFLGVLAVIFFILS